MNRLFFTLTLLFFLMAVPNVIISQKKELKNIDWKLVAQVENADGSPSLGFAGAINGISKEALLVCGGANFPNKMPWEGGQKHYSDEIHVLEKSGEKYIWNKQVQDKLPEPIAYCGNTATNKGIVYVGGENEKGLSKKAYLLNYEADKNSVLTKSLPDFPIAVTNIALTHFENTVYAVGGDEAKNSSNLFFSLDLEASLLEWKKLPDLPLALANSVIAIQNGKEGLSLYVVGGRTKTASGISNLHNTTFSFNLKKQVWKKGALISDGIATTHFSAGTGIAVGSHSILITGGDNGLVFHKIETYLHEIAQAKTPEEKEKWVIAKNELVTKHDGFYKGILVYDTLKDKWTKIGELPFLTPVTTTATVWNQDLILSNGEIKPGIRTPNIMLGRIAK